MQTVNVNGEEWGYEIVREFVRFHGPKDFHRVVTMWDFLGMTETQWRRKAQEDVDRGAIGMTITGGDVAMFIRRKM